MARRKSSRNTNSQHAYSTGYSTYLGMYLLNNHTEHDRHGGICETQASNSISILNTARWAAARSTTGRDKRFPIAKLPLLRSTIGTHVPEQVQPKH